MFILQAARVKAPGGIHTAAAHYERMFRATGVRSAVLFHGPAASSIGADSDIITDSFWLTGLQRDIRARANGEPLAVLVHSDLMLRRLRRLFPEAVTIAPCHSDKTKHKAGADLVVTLNPDQQRMVQAALPGARVRELGNPFVPPARDHSLAAATDAPRINFIGRFEGFKDPLTLIAAFDRAAFSSDVELRLIGSGRMDREVREAAARSAGKITLAGWHAQPFSLFNANDILVLPSLWESYSYVIREALDLGVPIVASDIHVHRGALGDGAYGILFPPGDSRALAAALTTALSDLPHLREMAARGGEAVRARYGAQPFWQAMRREIEWVLATRAK